MIDVENRIDPIIQERCTSGDLYECVYKRKHTEK